MLCKMFASGQYRFSLIMLYINVMENEYANPYLA